MCLLLFVCDLRAGTQNSPAISRFGLARPGAEKFVCFFLKRGVSFCFLFSKEGENNKKKKRDGTGTEQGEGRKKEKKKKNKIKEVVVIMSKRT